MPFFTQLETDLEQVKNIIFSLRELSPPFTNFLPFSHLLSFFSSFYIANPAQSLNTSLTQREIKSNATQVYHSGGGEWPGPNESVHH